jgi:hypothetical protein
MPEAGRLPRPVRRSPAVWENGRFLELRIEVHHMKRWVQRGMKLGTVLALAGAVGVPAWARVYRCGNEYTDRPQGLTGCRPMRGGDVTVIRGTGLDSAPRPSMAPGPDRSDAPRTVIGMAPRPHDADRVAILRRALGRALQRRADLEQEYRKGRPGGIGGAQDDTDRMAALEASLARNQGDIDGIERELARTGASAR